jgi:hypothetical protein
MYNHQSYYKASFSNSEKNKLLIVAILPFSYPDQACIYAAQEIKKFIETFFTNQLVYYFEHTELVIEEEQNNEEEKVDKQIQEKK